MSQCPACDQYTLEITHTEDDIEIRCTNCGYDAD
ncbi:Uncharacterised protein [Lysinibacillus sphaericus]|uniref:Uncharacterized protein n=1 Tax=Lysinibacillus sphaericus TaxID=1421 RepID=A0AAJ4ZSB7_LYSSH|nr:Uncharacterised protein [Lysinibacillus sphaericus]